MLINRRHTRTISICRSTRSRSGCSDAIDGKRTIAEICHQREDLSFARDVLPAAVAVGPGRIRHLEGVGTGPYSDELRRQARSR